MAKTKQQSTVRYPNVEVCLSGGDGNAFSIIAAVRKALRNAKVSQADIDEFTTQAQSGDYDNVLRTCMAWVDVS